MKNNKLMTPREEDLMNVFWNQKEPMALTDIIELLDKEQWNQVTLLRIVKKLLDKGYLEIFLNSIKNMIKKHIQKEAEKEKRH